jgi:Pyruvate/2-oxoacid:ferredoxin oxidoreductase delta subunit
MNAALSPPALVKFVVWLAMVIVATLMLRRGKISLRARIAFLAGGTLVFGFLFGLLTPANALDPNPVSPIRNLLRALIGVPAPSAAASHQQPLLAPLAGMLFVLLGMVWASNKSLCGWGCPVGLLQDLLHHVPLPKWRPSFRLTNSVRFAAFVLLVVGLALAGLDWIGVIDPFRLFSLDLTVGIALFGAALLVASLFTYRPWCRFLCPFGLLGWLVEQVSLLRPRIDRSLCRNCQLCVKACPTQSMADTYAGKAIRADCFACGACLRACPRQGALQWRTRLAEEKVKKEKSA